MISRTNSILVKLEIGMARYKFCPLLPQYPNIDVLIIKRVLNATFIFLDGLLTEPEYMYSMMLRTNIYIDNVIHGHYCKKSEIKKHT